VASIISTSLTTIASLSGGIIKGKGLDKQVESVMAGAIFAVDKGEQFVT